jgi:hypothetical protein
MPHNETKASTRVEEADGSVKAGMHGAGADPATEGAENEHPLDWGEMVRIGFVALAAGAFWFVGARLIPWRPIPACGEPGGLSGQDRLRRLWPGPTTGWQSARGMLEIQIIHCNQSP